MTDDAAKRRQRAAVALIATALAAVSFADVAVHAQALFRAPALNVGARIPTPVVPRIDPNIAGRVGDVAGGLHYSPNRYLSCSAANRGSNGECLDRTVSTTGGGGRAGKGKSAASRRGRSVTTATSTTIANEIMAEFDAALSDAQADALARRHRLVRLGSQNFPLIGATIGLFRITDHRSVATVSRELSTEAEVRSVQPNFRYLLQDQKTVPREGDPAQYALPKLRLPEAHALARGTNVDIAVIDSGIDAGHPELANSVVDRFDALGSKEGPHAHGTGVAGAIAAHAKLMGSAPAARIIAIRAFAQTAGGAASNTFVILKALDYAAAHGARIVNMSFAGPRDALVERGIDALAGRGIVMVAAAGNAGEKSPPLFPAANPNVIAVSAVDARDRLLSASNRGGYIALAAPGVDIFLPAPGDKYQMSSGTSFAAAYVSGIAALMLERNPALKPQELRTILMKTAHDLGSPGRDNLFGAGEADAYAAVEAVIAAQPALAGKPEPTQVDEKPTGNAPESSENQAVRVQDSALATVAPQKPPVAATNPSAPR